jgi:hypothetical protein
MYGGKDGRENPAGQKINLQEGIVLNIRIEKLNLRAIRSWSNRPSVSALTGRSPWPELCRWE